MNKFAELAQVLSKAGTGEGSHGGHVIGHTRSGKPIYASSAHPEHSGFKPQEHTDAMNQHYEIWSKTQDKINKIREKRPNWNPPKKIADFLQHHHTQMRMHQNRAGAGLDREEKMKAPKKFGVQEGKGVSANPYHTPQNIHKGLNDIEVPFMAVVVVLSPDRKKVLLGKRDKDNKGWESPAGHADIGERPEDVAIRECFEEFNVPLDEEQLEHLPIMYKKDMTPVHCFMAVTRPEQIKNVSIEDDPSQEHTEWGWFELDGKIPDAIEDFRYNVIVHAKMKLAGVIEMRKSYMQLDQTEGTSQMHTTEFAQESEMAAPIISVIESAMQDYKAGDLPVAIPLDEGTLHLVKIDDGIFSGFVKKFDRDGLEETVANIDKMTIPSMVQFLKAKQLISNKPQVSQEDKERQLKMMLDALIPKTEMLPMIYVSMDGDNIGNRVAQAEAENDEQKLIEMSHKIEAGQSVFRTWVQSVGGVIIESGGDEGLAKVPSNVGDKIENFRSQYMSVSGATVTVGVGKTISESTHARELGKLRGKNRVEFHSPETEAQLKELLKPQTEAQKIIDSGVLKLEKSFQDLRKSDPEMDKLIEEADKELDTDSEADIELKTAKKWAARAIAAIKRGKRELSEDFAHESLEHASLVKDEGKTVGDMQRKMKSHGVPFDIEVRKSFIDLIEALQRTEAFEKGQILPAGSVRAWNGQHFEKQASGHWTPTAGPAGGGGPTPDASDAPSDFQPPEDEPKPIKESGHLKHLKPQKGLGGHVTAHSKDVKNALKNGPFSLISADRNHSSSEDRGMPDEHVAERKKSLEKDLKDMGHKYMKVKGKYNGADKDSYMVFHSEPEKMDELGKKYNQESVLHSSEGKNRLHFTSGPNEGKHHKGEGHEMISEAKDNYTEAKTSNGKKMKFHLGMDYGKIHGKA